MGGEVNTYSHTSMFKLPKAGDYAGDAPSSDAPSSDTPSSDAPGNAPDNALSDGEITCSPADEERWSCAAVVSGFANCSAASHNNG